MTLKSAGAFIRRLADKPIPNERKAKRTACEIPCYLFNGEGIATAGVILDRSAGGVKIRCDGADGHDRAAYVLRMDTGAAYALRLAWRVGPLAGYEFRHRVDLRSRHQDIATDALKAAWQEHRQAQSRTSLMNGDQSPKGDQ